MYPYFNSLSDFIAMGTHGVYVWASWGLVFAVIIGLIIHTRYKRKKLLKELKQQQKHQALRQKAKKNMKDKESIS